MRKWTPLKRHPGIYEYTTAKGKRYGTRRSYTNAYKEHHEWTRSGFINWRDADIELKQFESDLASGKLSTSTTHKVTVGEYYQRLSERKVKLGQWNVETAANIDSVWRTHFKDTFGNMKIDQLDRHTYQHFIDGLVMKGYAKTTIFTINATMQRIMNDAEINNVIFKNQLKRIEIIGAKGPKSKDLSEQDYNKLLKTAKEIFPRYRYGILALLTLGERREELLGLQYSSFEFSKDENGDELCAISFKTGRTARKKNGGNLKTPASYRTIYVSGEMCDIIHYMIDESKRICTKFNKQITKDSFLIINRYTGEPAEASLPNHLLKKLEEVTGIHSSPHIFRHFFATMAMTNGEPDTDVMHWLGHSSVIMTQSYTRANKRGSLNVFKGMEGTLLDNQTISSSKPKDRGL